MDAGGAGDEKGGSSGGLDEDIKGDFLHHTGSREGAHLTRTQAEQGDLPALLRLYIGAQLAG